jgi:MFS family permease
MSVTAAGSVPGGGGLSSLWNRQLDAYPETGRRMLYLGITVLSTVMLYYELYVAGSVSTLILAKLNMSFTFFVVTLAIGNLLGAFGSLFAGLTDRLGRTNLVVVGLIITAIFVAFIIPAATDKWTFTIESFVVGIVEGICLVATPALIRDFSPQVGRATAMGFWTSGPVLGSLAVAVVAAHTVGNTPSTSFWTHEYHICGIAGLVVAVIAVLGLKELSPGLRDQLMVTMRDRALVEARAQGIDIEASLRNPWRQLLKPDVIVSALGISVFLLIYYTAVGFGLIYFITVFGFSVKDANALGNWNWGFNVIAVILFGFLSDKLRVRKPFMIVGGVAAAVMMIVYLEQSKHGIHEGYYKLAIIVAILSFTLGIAYVPWMASFTETVEARNPALTATGLAIWGWIIRVVVFGSYLILLLVINTVTPLVTYGGTVSGYAAGSPRYHIPPEYPALAFDTPANAHIIATAQSIPTPVIAAAQAIPSSVIATATQYSTQLGNAQKFAPELAAIQAHPSVFLGLQTNPTNTTLLAQAVQALGGGATGQARLATLAANQAAIQGVIAVASQLQTVVPYAADLKLIAPYSSQLTTIAPYSKQLAGLAAVPKSVDTYLGLHATKVSHAAAKTASQWRNWYWICFGCMIFFLLTVPLMRGQWSPRKAKADEDAHEAMVQAELAKLNQGASV